MDINNYSADKKLSEVEAYALLQPAFKQFLINHKNYAKNNRNGYAEIIDLMPPNKNFYVKRGRYNFLVYMGYDRRFNICLNTAFLTVVEDYSHTKAYKMFCDILSISNPQISLFL
jgi:hypothetical protein